MGRKGGGVESICVYSVSSVYVCIVCKRLFFQFKTHTCTKISWVLRTVLDKKHQGSYICIAGVYIVFSFTFQYNPPLVSYSARISKDVSQISTQFVVSN